MIAETLLKFFFIIVGFNYLMILINGERIKGGKNYSQDLSASYFSLNISALIILLIFLLIT